MSREAGKTRPLVKRQTKIGKKGERQLDKQAHDLQHKADHVLADGARHSAILSSQDKTDIQTSVEQLEFQAGRLDIIDKVRTKHLDTVEEHLQPSSSEGEEEEENHSRIGSLETMSYTNTLNSPFTLSVTEKSPTRMDPPPVQRFNTTPSVNPQFVLNPPPAMPNVSVMPADPLAMMQAMFAQQAQANQLQQQAMLAHQAQVSKQQAEANQQLQTLLAKSLDRQLDQHDKQLKQQENTVERQAMADVRVAVKQMRDGNNIVQYFEHFELELGDAQIPPAKWKTILVGKLSPKAERVCAHLVNDPTATYDDMKRYLLHNIGPSMDEMCNIVHGAYHSEFQDKREAQKLQHCKYLAERYFLGAKNKEEHLAVRLYKFHSQKRFSHNIKLSKAQSFTDLLELATSFDGQLEYEKANKQHGNQPHYREKYSQKKPFCDYCRKLGHVEADCFKKQGTNKSNPTHTKNFRSNPIDTQTNNNVKQTKTSHKDAGVKPRSVNWSQTCDTVNSIKGTINEQEVEIVIDTGAQITVVPGKFIYDDNLTGETVSILGVNGDPMPYQTANIPITLRGKTVWETVAVAPEDQLNAKVLLSAPMDTKITDKLLENYFNKQQKNDKKLQVNAITRSSTAKTPAVKYFSDTSESEVEDDRASDLSYQPSSDSNLSDSEATIASDEHLPDKSYAPVDKCLNNSPLPSSPQHPKSQTLYTP